MFDHLAANGTGLTAGQIAIVALLQVDANLLGGLHLELVQGLTGAGNHGLVGIGIVRARHNSASPLVTNLLDSVNPDIALPQGGFLCAPFFAGRVCEKKGNNNTDR